MKNNRLYAACFLLVMLSLLLSSCAVSRGNSAFLRPSVDINYIKKVAVLPFGGNGKDVLAATRARDITITQLLARHIFDVVDKGLVDSVLQEEAIEPGTPLDKAMIKRIGQRLNVQALVLGTVDQADIVRHGMFSYPEISITLRLVDVKSGLILWQATGHASGYSFLGRLFGLQPESEYQVTFRAINNLLSTL